MADLIEYKAGDRVMMTKEYLATYCGCKALEGAVGEVKKVSKTNAIVGLWLQFPDDNRLFLAAVDGVVRAEEASKEEAKVE